MPMLEYQPPSKRGEVPARGRLAILSLAFVVFTIFGGLLQRMLAETSGKQAELPWRGAAVLLSGGIGFVAGLAAMTAADSRRMGLVGAIGNLLATMVGVFRLLMLA